MTVGMLKGYSPPERPKEPWRGRQEAERRRSRRAADVACGTPARRPPPWRMSSRDLSLWDRLQLNGWSCTCRQSECPPTDHCCTGIELDSREGRGDEFIPRRSEEEEMAWIDQSAFADVNSPPVPGMLIHRSAALGSMSIPWADLHGQKRGEVKSYLPPVSKGPHTLLPDPTFISGLAVPAHRYVAVESDIMDVEVARRLQELSPAAAGALRLRRLEPGRYEIDGRLVTVRRRCATAWDGDDVCLLVP